MADPKLVEILKQGSMVWNRWYKGQLEYRHTDLDNPKMSYANLNNVRLAYANLSGVDLNNSHLGCAHLSYANLSGANLTGSYLSSAHLNGANLRSAHLNGTLLTCANLSGAHLSGANLSFADLSQANLGKTNWTNATICGTKFINIDLRGVIGLETVQHKYPSTIGLDTIYLSNGQIPEVFLRGAGVPETFITNMRALIDSMSPIEFYSCFIAYSHRNEDFAKRLHADLQAKGVRCWFAPEDLKIGDHYHQRIDEAIRLYDKLILVLSDAAVCSAWVEREVVAAREKEDRQQREVLFPLRLDDAVMATEKAWAVDVRRR